MAGTNHLKPGSVREVSLTLLCLFAVLYPLFAGPGPVNTRGGGDSPFLFVRLEQLVAGLRAGAFPVRWMPDAAYGLGYPFFHFYTALPYYLAAAFRLLGWGPILSLQLTQAIGFALAAAAMALLAWRAFRHPAAVTLAAIAYTCAPFHLVNVYVRGDSLSEFYAFVFYPLILWALLRLRDRPSWANVPWLALSYGGLILTHNLSAIMFTPFVVVCALFLIQKGKATKGCTGKGKNRIDWEVALRMAAGGALGLALSVSLWFVSLADLDAVWMGHKAIQTSGYFNYAGHLRGRDLIQPALAFNYDVAPGNTPFAMGAVQAMSILAGMVVLAAGWLRRPRTGTSPARSPSIAMFWIAGLALSTFMITPASRFLWDRLPMLPIVQFPWRFLSVQALFGALIVGELARRLPHPWWVTAACASLLVLAAVWNLHPEYLPIQEADVTAERLALFESFTTNIGTTIRGEYLPRAVEPQPFASAVTLNRGQRPPPAALAGQIDRATLIARDARSECWQVTVASAGPALYGEKGIEGAYLAFYTLYFPGWQGRVDGRPVVIAPLPNTGLIAIRVPGGEHEVCLRLGRTPIHWTADLISLAALGVVAGLAWPLLRAARTVRWQRWATLLGGAALLGGLLSLGGMLSAPQSLSAAHDLSMDFDRMPFLHHNPQGIDFGRARLDAYAYDTETAQDGSAITLTLTWGYADPNLVACAQLVTPADAHPRFAPPPPPLASADAHIQGRTTTHVLPVPADAASGPYYVSLRVLDGDQEVRARTAQGHTLGTTYLRPIWIDNPRPAQEGEPVQATGGVTRFGDQILLRDDVEVKADEKNWDVRLTWQAVARPSRNYTCSLRMLAADGTPLPQAQRDLEGGPGYGFWPTSAWPVGEWVTDRLRMPIPPDVRAEDAAALVVVLYDRSQPDFPAAGSAIVPLVEREHRYSAPEVEYPVGATFGEQVKLLGYDLARDAAQLHLTLYWQATQPMSTAYTAFVHLFDPTTETIVSQVDVKPLDGLYPTNWWRSGEIVADQMSLPLAGVPAGSYFLAVGLYNASDGTRLPVANATGETWPDGRLVLSTEFAIGPE